MRWLKIGAVVLGVYAAFVVVFETFYLGMHQPELEATGIPMLVVTTTDATGRAAPRRLARFVTDGKVYVSAHHWTRGWYHRALENPAVVVEMDGVVADYVAAAVAGEEFERVAAAYPIPFVPRLLMGFPPKRNILRLDPVTPGAS